MGLRVLVAGLALAVVMVIDVACEGDVKGPIQPFFVDGIQACTTFSVHEEDQLWLTAAHCVNYDEKKKFTIGDKESEAELRRVDVVFDLALLMGGRSEKALRLAKGVKDGQEIRVRGFGAGVPEPMVFFGRVVSVGWTIPEDEHKSAIYDVEPLVGLSGSPVFNSNEEVVGMFNGFYQRGPSKVSWGPTWAQLKSFMGAAWEGEGK
jgi:hypothetical protein